MANSRNVFVSWFWELQVQDRDVGRVGSFTGCKEAFVPFPSASPEFTVLRALLSLPGLSVSYLIFVKVLSLYVSVHLLFIGRES